MIPRSDGVSSDEVPLRAGRCERDGDGAGPEGRLSATSGSAAAGAVTCRVPLRDRRALLLLTPMPLHDFMTYWAAGRLFLTGRNPYSMSAMLAIETSLGWPYTQHAGDAESAVGVAAGGAAGADAVRGGAYVVVRDVAGDRGACSLALCGVIRRRARQRWIALMLLATFLPAATAEHMGRSRR